jgi:hypothetical protein
MVYGTNAANASNLPVLFLVLVSRSSSAGAHIKQEIFDKLRQNGTITKSKFGKNV